MKMFHVVQSSIKILCHPLMKVVSLFCFIMGCYVVAFPPAYHSVVPVPYANEGKAAVSSLHIPIKQNPFWEVYGEPLGSSLVLYENDNRLDNFNSLHENIRKYGGGRFSHYEKNLYFSSSDNTEVSKNGRVYRFETTLQPSLWVIICIIFTGFCLLVVFFVNFSRNKFMRLCLINVTISIVILLVMFISGELYVRFGLGISAHPNFPMMYNPKVGTILQQSSTIVSTNYTNFFVKEKINSRVFLDYEPAKPTEMPNKVRIAFIGDSFVEASQVPIAKKFT